MRRQREPRDRTVATKFTAEELGEVQRMADNERMSLSEYVRGATLSYMALRGNKLAWKLMGAGLAALVRETMGKWKEAVG